MTDQEYLVLIDKVGSKACTDQEFMACVDEGRNRLMLIEDYHEAAEWAWTEICPNLLGHWGERDWVREIELWEKKRADLIEEYGTIPKSDPVYRLKVGQSIKEITEIIKGLNEKRMKSLREL